MSFSKRQFTLAATALGSSLAFIDATAVIVALPSMQKSLSLGLSGEQWIFLSYSLALASLYLVGGSLGDRYGHRQVFTRGVVGFALASILAGLAPNGLLLIIARVLQGICGAFVTTNSLAWLRNVYGNDAGKAVGLWTSLTAISTIIAPLLGGALTQWFSWRWIFYINLPLAVLVLYWSSKAEPGQAKSNQDRPLDIVGSALIAVSFGFLCYYLVQGTKAGFSSLWWSLAIGLIGLIGFVITELNTKNPMLPMRLFKIRNFSFANFETLLIYGALYGVLVYLTLYLQFLGLSPLSSSLFLIPPSVVLILLAPYFGGLADRRGPKAFLTAGPLLIGTSALLFSLIGGKDQIPLAGGFGIILFSFGLAMLVAPITTVALKSVPASFAGIASGLNNTFSRIGSLTVVAVVGMIISIIFYNTVADSSMVPLGVDPQSLAVAGASRDAFQVGMWVVAALAYAAAAVGFFGITNNSSVSSLLKKK